MNETADDLNYVDMEYDKALARYTRISFLMNEYGEEHQSEIDQLTAAIDKYSYLSDHVKAGQPLKDAIQDWKQDTSFDGEGA